MDLDLALHEWPMHKVYGHIKFLPPDAALWRVQESEPPKIKTNDANKIAAFFNEAGMDVNNG